MGASTLESTRLLLNSKCREYPNGLANSSGVLVHYLFDQFYVKGVVTAIVPEARSEYPREELHSWLRLRFRQRRFTPPRLIPKYGDALLKEMADLANAAFGMTTMGEVLPRREHFVRINPDVKDEWGIPVLHITQRYTDNEHAMAKDSMNVAEELCRDAGFEILSKHHEMVPPGESIHELGTCRMGSDPKTSVLNAFNQSHDIKNLFVMDGSAFVCGGSQNPTLTIVSLAMRASEYLAEQMRRGDV